MRNCRRLCLPHLEVEEDPPHEVVLPNGSVPTGEQDGQGALDGLARRAEAQALQGVEQVGMVLPAVVCRLGLPPRFSGQLRPPVEQHRLAVATDPAPADLRALVAQSPVINWALARRM